MGETAIEWTDVTWNPVRGCTRISEGCRHCYAEQQAARIVRMGKGKPTPYDGLVRTVGGGEARWTGVVRLVPEHLADPLRWRRPRRIFVNSMSDLFHESLTNEQIAAVFGVMAACPQHTFQVLTKRARRMREWFEWATRDHYPTRGQSGVGPHVRDSMQRYALDALAASGVHGIPVNRDMKWPLSNVWLGTSVENQDAADERIPELLDTPAAVRFISAEPLLGELSIPSYLRGTPAHRAIAGYAGLADEPGVDWVIAGCESGAGARPCDVAWLRSLRDQCAAAGVPYFLKQAVEDVEMCDEGCGERVRYQVIGRGTAIASCGCTIEGGEVYSPVGIEVGEGSHRKPGGLIGLPYLDGVQHAAMPNQIALGNGPGADGA